MNKPSVHDVQLRYRVFAVKYCGPGQVRGSRVIIHDLRNNRRKVLPYDDELGLSGDQALGYLEKRGIKVHALGLHDVAVNGSKVELLLSEDFKTPLVDVREVE